MIKLKGPHYVALKSEPILERHLNKSIDFFFESSNRNKKIKEQIEILLALTKENHKELELLLDTDFDLLYQLKKNYDFEAVEYNSAAQIKNVMSALELLPAANPKLIGQGMTLSFLSDGPDKVYYNNGFSEDYIESLRQIVVDNKLKQDLLGDVGEFVATAYALQNADITDSDRQLLQSDIETSIANTNKNIGSLQKPKMVSLAKIKDERQLNLENHEQVLAYDFDSTKVVTIREKYNLDNKHPELSQS